jgi:hypothetical protein
MTNEIMALKKYTRTRDGREEERIKVLLLYDIPVGIRLTDAGGNPIVLTPSTGLPAEALDVNLPNPITAAEQAEFDAGTGAFFVHEFGIHPGWGQAEVLATAQRGWHSRQAELLAAYNAMGNSWQWAGVRVAAGASPPPPPAKS